MSIMPRDSAKFWSRIMANMFNDVGLSRVRIVSGLIIFFYVTVHFLNHALGLISLEVMSAVGFVIHEIIAFPPISVVLYGAILAHIVAALWKVFQRKTLKLQVREWVQLVFGLALPLLILTHVIGTRYAHEVYGIIASYDYVLLSTFYFSPISGVLNAAALVVAWLHGCLGLHMWLQTKRGYRQSVQTSLAIATVLIPVLALTGYLSAGREILPSATDGEFMEAYFEHLNLSSDAVWGMLKSDIDGTRLFIFALVIAVFLARIIRAAISSKTDTVEIEFVDGPKIVQPVGPTLLEMSKLSDVPHASVCGGRGRCSTCRVRIVGDTSSLSPPNDSEVKVLHRIRAENDVRLACQINPTTDLKVIRLLPSDGSSIRPADNEPSASGREKTVTVMFADLRDFTKTSETRLPFDVVYLINQFSKAMGEAVEEHGGIVDKFLGDGFMALFGVNESEQEGAMNALNAANSMIKQLELLNQRLESDLDEPLRMGVGVHTGSVILGNMGYGSARGLTAIGDTVNTASRLEAATKTQHGSLCVSADTVEIAGMIGMKDDQKRITIRGKKIELNVYALENVNSLTKAPDGALV